MRHNITDDEISSFIDMMNSLALDGEDLYFNLKLTESEDIIIEGIMFGQLIETDNGEGFGLDDIDHYLSKPIIKFKKSAIHSIEQIKEHFYSLKIDNMILNIGTVFC